jgi:hypothetical protein
MPHIHNGFPMAKRKQEHLFYPRNFLQGILDKIFRSADKYFGGSSMSQNQHSAALRCAGHQEIA